MKFDHYPKITVVTPSFNQGKYIRETIESVLAQNYPNLEYIIIDGGSTDSTTQIIEDYIDQISYFVSEKDNGQSHALNKGFARSTGDILCWLNSDDQFAPNALLAVALAFSRSKADMVAGICETYKEGNLIQRHLTACSNGVLPLQEMLDLDNGWNAGQFFYQPEVFFKRELWLKCGGYVREDCYFSMDYELWCRFAHSKAVVNVIGIPLAYLRLHQEQKTAETEKFKAELVKVRDKFLQEHNLKWLGSERPGVNWLNRLRVAFINDVGYQYGAGIAQLRLAGAFDLAGHDISAYDLCNLQDKPDWRKVLVKQVKSFEPDLIIFGNIHYVERTSIELIKIFEKDFPCYWVAHDFWLFTGRCAYLGDCKKYQTHCDETCPTADEYPAVDPSEIYSAWEKKVEFLRTSKNLTVITSSHWAKHQVKNFRKVYAADFDVEPITLGVPQEIYSVGNQAKARSILKVSDDSFTLVFSVSSLSEKRKGGAILKEAIGLLPKDLDITVLLIGRVDIPFKLPGVKLIKLGYLHDVHKLANALRAADLYVGPSTEETFGQVFMEAAMCGTPSLGFDVTGVSDAIVENITGIKIKEVSAKALANQLETLYHQREILSKIARLAPVYARSRFSIEAAYHSFFCILNKQGVIDQKHIAHKISFSQASEVIANKEQGWVQCSSPQKLEMALRNSANRCISFFPNSFVEKCKKWLPRRMEKAITNFLIGRK